MDLLSNMLANIKQASSQKRPFVIVHNTRVVQCILVLLIELGFIYSFYIINSRKIQIFLKYDEQNKPAIRNIQRVSKPGSRVYMTYKSLCVFARNNNVTNIYQVAIISSSKGILTTQKALRLKLGGEILFLVS